jgi:3-oxoacyl-[acyl-carrier-protein] synthase-3
MGEYGDILDMPGVGSEMPTSHEVVDNNFHYFRMKGAEVFKQAVRGMAEVSNEVLSETGLKVSDIDWVIPHQANIRIIDSVAKKLNVPSEKILLNVHKYGNTSAATIPTCIDEFIDNGKIKKGDLLLMTSFGGGLTYAGAVIRW